MTIEHKTFPVDGEETETYVHGVVPGHVDGDGSFIPADDSPVKVMGSFSALSLAASGVAFAAPGTLVRLIVDDPGSSGTVKVWDNASAGSGTGYGAPTKIATSTQVIEYGVAMANGCYVELGGSAKVTAIFKLDP